MSMEPTEAEEETAVGDYKAAFLEANKACTAREEAIITLQQRLASTGARAETLARQVAAVEALADAPHVMPLQTLEGVENAPVVWPHEIRAALRGDPRMTARTISLAEMEARVPDATDIELPGPEGGWAVAVINGREYRARVGAVEEHRPVRAWEAEDSYRDVCRKCGERWPCRVARVVAEDARHKGGAS